jgi:pimeloyl-ACP methyl ester carboxylesterase
MKKYIHFMGGKLYYSDTGEGNPVVLLHGYLESSEVWNAFAEKLSRRYRVISMDLPGHGHSTIFGESHSMEFMATLIKGLLDSLDIKKIFLTGHSLGGYVALAFLELFPEQLKGYCLFHSHPLADTPEVILKREREIKVVKSGRKFLIYPENISKMFADENLERLKEAVQQLKDIASRLSDEGIIAVLNGMITRPSRVKIMEKATVPCLWILGRHDKYISCDSVLEKVRVPSNARLFILEKSGHLGFIEEEETSLRIVTDFIEKLKN